MSIPGPSRPDGEPTLVPYAPSSAALAFIFVTATSLAAEHGGQRVGGVVARHQ